MKDRRRRIEKQIKLAIELGDGDHAKDLMAKLDELEEETRGG